MTQQKKKPNNISSYLNVGLLILSLLGVYLFIAAVNDYKWGQEYVNARKDEWEVVIAANGRTSPFYFYSLFDAPVTLISLINKKESKILQDNIVYVENLWAKRDVGVGYVKEERYSYLVNCNTFKSGWNSNYSMINKNNIDLNSVKWHLEESSESIEQYKTICDIIKIRINKATN